MNYYLMLLCYYEDNSSTVHKFNIAKLSTKICNFILKTDDFISEQVTIDTSIYSPIWQTNGN